MKRGDLNDFQVREPHVFDSMNTQKRRLKRKKTPEYRKINRYFKSTKQYWKERNRRQQVLKLTNEGYTLQQIAKEIGCSYRTIRRDAGKLERYIKGQFNSYMDQLRREARAKLEAELDGLSTVDMGQRFKMITNLMFKTRKLSKAEVEKQHNNIIFVNFDKPNSNGFPTVELARRGGVFKTPYNLSLIAVKDNQPYVLGGIKIG